MSIWKDTRSASASEWTRVSETESEKRAKLTNYLNSLKNHSVFVRNFSMRNDSRRRLP